MHGYCYYFDRFMYDTNINVKQNTMKIETINLIFGINEPTTSFN